MGIGSSVYFGSVVYTGEANAVSSEFAAHGSFRRRKTA
jgi:hypothetical protein